MGLKILNVKIHSTKEFMKDVKESLLGKNKILNTLSFDSIETFKKVISANRLQILMAVSRLKPESINQLAKLLDREFPHVLKDCRALEEFGFIKFEEAKGPRKQISPRLASEYDIIRVNSTLEEIFPISERSNQLLLGKIKVS